MDKSYQPHDIEGRVYARWEERGYFAPRGDGERYCIMIPPPNVTGSLHMGHAFQDTIMDALTRYKRMLEVALAGDRLIAMALLKQPRAEEFHETVCVGHDEIEDRRKEKWQRH